MDATWSGKRCATGAATSSSRSAQRQCSVRELVVLVKRTRLQSILWLLSPSLSDSTVAMWYLSRLSLPSDRRGRRGLSTSNSSAACRPMRCITVGDNIAHTRHTKAGATPRWRGPAVLPLQGLVNSLRTMSSAVHSHGLLTKMTTTMMMRTQHERLLTSASGRAQRSAHRPFPRHLCATPRMSTTSPHTSARPR